MKWWTLCVLIFLYFLQGMPYGIQVNFLPLLLRAKGVSLSSISFFKLLFLPWTLKITWAPYVDRYGTKKQWLMATLCLLSVACMLTSQTDFANIPVLAAMLFIQNLCVSIQDIAVDSLTVSMLASGEVSMGNVAQVVGYKIGGMLGGYTYMQVHTHYGHGSVYSILTVTYLIAFLLVALLDLNFKSKKSHKDHEMEEGVSSAPHTYIETLKQAVTTPGTLWMIGYTLLYKCGENASISTLPLYLVDNGMEKTTVAFYTGVVGTMSNIFASILGGYFLRGRSVYTSSCYLNISRFLMLVIITFIISNSILNTQYTGGLVIFACLQHFLSGLSTIITFTWMMSLSQSAHQSLQSTHYTALATSEILGKLMFASIVGTLADALGYTGSFMILSLSALILVFYTYTASPPVRALSKKSKD